MDTRTILTPADWLSVLERLPDPHLLQSWTWGEFKKRVGWQAERLSWGTAAAQLLHRSYRLPGLRRRLTVSYCPRGPVLDWGDAPLRRETLIAAAAAARRWGAIFLKIDPGLPIGFGDPQSGEASTDPLGLGLCDDLIALGWKPSREQIQFRNTFTLDLRPPEEAILARMKQKTRYNIRLAERRGVTVRLGRADDLDLLYRLYAETALRDGFAIRSPAYYLDVWGTFLAAGLAQPLLAEVEKEPVAALIVFRYGATAWYLYGMSAAAHRELMPNHLLQWEAIRWARAQGCRHYDLWGAPDRLDPSDRLWGVYRFKEGFGARLVRTAGAWDLPLRPGLYWLYSLVLPRLMAVWRLRGRRQTRQSLEA